MWGESSPPALPLSDSRWTVKNWSKSMLQNHRYHLFHSMHSSSFPKPGTYITLNTTRPPRAITPCCTVCLCLVSLQTGNTEKTLLLALVRPPPTPEKNINLFSCKMFLLTANFVVDFVSHDAGQLVSSVFFIVCLLKIAALCCWKRC